MSFAKIAANKTPTSGCPVGNIVAGLPDDEAQCLRDMLAADIDTWPHTGGTLPEHSIQLALRAEGYNVGDRVIRLHRIAACRCYRDSR